MANTIQLRNSVVKDKTPLPSQLIIGEVCVGAHEDSPMLIFKDNADNIIKIEPGSGVTPSPDAPDSPSAGDLWFDSNNSLLYYYNGTDWVELGTAGDSPVTSVNGKVGTVVLTAADVGALPDDTALDFVPLGSWAAIPSLSIAGPGRDRPLMDKING